MLNVNCPHCGNQLQVPEKYAGMTGRCKHCGEKLTIPKMASAEDLDENKAGAGLGEQRHDGGSVETLSEEQYQQLEKLAALKASGVLNEEEFSVEKARILAQTTSAHPIDTTAKASQRYTSYDQVPFYRKQWFFWSMAMFNFLVILNPVAIVLLVSGDVYYKKKGEVKSFGIAVRIVLGIILLLFNSLGWHFYTGYMSTFSQ